MWCKFVEQISLTLDSKSTPDIFLFPLCVYVFVCECCGNPSPTGLFISCWFLFFHRISLCAHSRPKKKQPAQSAQDQRQGMRPPRAHGRTFDIFPASAAIKYPARRRPLFSSRDSPLDYSHVLGRLISPPDGCCCCRWNEYTLAKPEPLVNYFQGVRVCTEKWIGLSMVMLQYSPDVITLDNNNFIKRVWSLCLSRSFTLSAPLCVSCSALSHPACESFFCTSNNLAAAPWPECRNKCWWSAFWAFNRGIIESVKLSRESAKVQQ